MPSADPTCKPCLKAQVLRAYTRHHPLSQVDQRILSSGKFIRVSAQTRSWENAKRKVRAMDADAEPSRKPDPETAIRISIEDAVQLRLSRQTGLKAIAITDHDTLAGSDAAFPLATECGVELVCGVEQSTQFVNGRHRVPSMHVLAYFLDLRYQAQSQSGTDGELQASNIDISWEDFPHLGPELAARPHFARGLVEKGYVPDLQSAVDLHLCDLVLDGIERKLPSIDSGSPRLNSPAWRNCIAGPSWPASVSDF